MIVCIEDGGINYTHGDIAANMWSGIGYNFVNNTPMSALMTMAPTWQVLLLPSATMP
ncbi:MAG: hypothetical protein IPF68_03700 [Bacteroidales bacterium]|nr:hypothetical protein [Bacteroidales bacterium]